MRPHLKTLLRRSWIRWVAVVVLLAGAAYGVYAYRARQAAGELPAGVIVAKAEQQTLEQKISASGVVAAQTGAQVKIGAQLSGRIKELRADVGQKVKAGDTIAVLDLPDMEAQVRQARDSVAQAESRHRQAIETAQWTKEQTEEEVRHAEAALAAADARLVAAQAAADWQPEQTKSEIARSEAALATARSLLRQVNASVQLQLNQAQATIDAEAAEVDNLKRQLARTARLQARGLAATEATEILRTHLAQSRSRLASARANYGVVKEKTAADRQAAEDGVRQAQANLGAAKANRFQDRRMVAEQQNALKAREQALAQLQLARAGRRQVRIRAQAVHEAVAALEQAKNQLRYQDAQMDKAFIRSNLSGTVVSIDAQQGETVAAAFAAPTLIVVTDLNRLEVKAYVDETDIGQVKKGLPAEVRVDSYSERVFTGRVTKIASASTVKDNVVTYQTTVALDNPQGLLKPDMTAAVEILLQRRPDVLSVPSEAIKRVGEQQVVYVLPQGAAAPKKRAVRTGLDNGMRTQILEGIKPGERVVLAGLDKLGVRDVGFTTRR